VSAFYAGILAGRTGSAWASLAGGSFAPGEDGFVQRDLAVRRVSGSSAPARRSAWRLTQQRWPAWIQPAPAPDLNHRCLTRTRPAAPIEERVSLGAPYDPFAPR